MSESIFKESDLDSAIVYLGLSLDKPTIRTKDRHSLYALASIKGFTISLGYMLEYNILTIKSLKGDEIIAISKYDDIYSSEDVIRVLNTHIQSTMATIDDDQPTVKESISIDIPHLVEYCKKNNYGFQVNNPEVRWSIRIGTNYEARNFFLTVNVRTGICKINIAVRHYITDSTYHLDTLCRELVDIEDLVSYIKEAQETCTLEVNKLYDKGMWEKKAVPYLHFND